MGNRFRSLWGSQALKLIRAFTCLGLVLVFSGDCGPDRGFDYPCIDNDGDGYGELCNPGPDCDDTIANVWSDCSDCVDSEGDLWGVGTSCDANEDCDDADRFSYPGAPELGCNSKDNNCDDSIDEAEVVVFADANLEAGVKTILGLTPGATVYNDDFCGIDSIVLKNLSIVYLDGLEYAVDVTLLDLYSNQVSDISALAGLTALTFLGLAANQVSDISALAGLTALESLYLNSNQVSDISALAGLTALRTLNLAANQVSDISALAGLTALRTLNLTSNQVSDISALAGLTALISLYLNFNQVSDISALAGLTALTFLALDSNQFSDLQPLVDNSGIDLGDFVYISGNPLDSESCCTDIPILIGRGADVTYGTSCNDYDGCP